MTTDWLTTWLATHEDELIAVRRQLHSQPELSFAEHATTDLIMKRLSAAGLHPRRLPHGTGAVVDIGSGERTVALRGDIDALPLNDKKSAPYRSRIDGVCHACGHDAHTAITLGAALALAEAPELPGRVRLIFQHAEEKASGARDVIAAGELEGVERIFTLHCDPSLPVGQVGMRVGAITAACDMVELRLTGTGGHTARPHLTTNLVDTLSRIVSQSPTLVAQRVDARSGLLLVWGAMQAGEAFNTIPSRAIARGTLRVLDHEVWNECEKHVQAVISDLAAMSGATVDLRYERGVPPVINDHASVELMRGAVESSIGAHAVADTQTSMGGEDFGWYGEHVPLGMARLGVYSSKLGTQRDLHQGDFDIDERSIAVGVQTFVHTALAALTP